jgi:hypothetical protein
LVVVLSEQAFCLFPIFRTGSTFCEQSALSFVGTNIILCTGLRELVILIVEAVRSLLVIVSISEVQDVSDNDSVEP